MKHRLSQTITCWTCLVAYLFVAATASGAVWCESSDGHTAVESTAVPCPTSTPQDHESATIGESSCHDTLILAVAHLNIQTRVEVSHPLAVTQPFDLTTPIDRLWSTHQFPGFNPLPDRSALVSLRSVILLV